MDNLTIGLLVLILLGGVIAIVLILRLGLVTEYYAAWLRSSIML